MQLAVLGTSHILEASRYGIQCRRVQPIVEEIQVKTSWTLFEFTVARDQGLNPERHIRDAYPTDRG